jgi:hypothetical protein
MSYPGGEYNSAKHKSGLPGEKNQTTIRNYVIVATIDSLKYQFYVQAMF